MVQIKIKYFLFGFACIVACVFVPKAAKAATLSLSPASQSIVAGNTFSVNIFLDATAQAIYGADVYSLHFNPAILQVVDADAVTAGVQIAPGALMSNTQYNSVNNSTGIIQFSQTPAATSANYTGNGILATVTFQAVGVGTSAVTFDFTAGSTTDTNVAGLYSDLLTAVTNANYTVTNSSDTTAPSVPTGVAAAAGSATQVNFSWTASTDPVIAGQTTSGIAGYKIYRNGGFSPIATVTSGTSYQDTGLTANTTYTYAVASYDNAGNNSAKSANVPVTTLNGTDAAPPSVPSGLSATSTISTGATVAWIASTDPAVAGQVTSGVAGYKVLRCSGASCTPTVQVATSTSMSFTDSGLTAFTSYSYRVQAYDNAGNVSAFSSTVSVITITNADVAAPSIPLNVSAQVISQSQVNLSWSASTDPTIAGQVTSGVAGYKIYRNGIQVATSTAASFSNMALSPATSYSYSVSAYDNAGNASAQTSAVNVTTQSNPDSSAPTVFITSPSGGSVAGIVSFAASASDPVVGGAVTSGMAQITLFIDNRPFANSSVGAATMSVSLDTTTLTNSTHQLVATARDSAGNSSTSSTVSINVFNLVNATRFPKKITLSSLEGKSTMPAGQPIMAVVFSPSTQAILSTQSLVPDGTGVYTVSFDTAFPQVVSVRVLVSGYLSRVLSSIDTTVSAANFTTISQLLAGDSNGDNTINTLDYSALNSHWLQNYAGSDINSDGLVNSLDYAVLKNNWNKNGE